MESRGRGRARGGRARGEPSQQQSARPGPSGPGAPPQGAWGRPQAPQPQRQGPPQQRQGPPQPRQGPQTQPSQAPQGAWARPQPAKAQQPPPQQGRGSRVPGGDEASTSRPVHEAPNVVSGAGDPGIVRDPAVRERGGGNGGVRGRTNRNEIIHTKPASLRTKQGSSGTSIKLFANYFKLMNRPDWCLHHYSVDFDPVVDDTRIKKKLVYIAYKQENDIGGFLFDGSSLFTPLKLHPDPLERFAKVDETERIRIVVKRVDELKWGDWHYLQVFNILVRKCLQMLNLQLVGRNYFDTQAEVAIPDHRLCLWPGYFTSIRQYEKDIMMNTELTFKVMRSDNVYDLLLQSVDRSGQNDVNAFVKKITGNIVLTFYNNKTYRIDDVDFKSTPASTFKTRSGEEISYIQYYKQRYAINIQVPSQPMLVSRSKPREIRAGLPETVYLVPELCQLTGLSDDQRANFHLMSALATHTRIDPRRRQGKLLEFVRKLASNAEIMKEIRRWEMSIADQLVQFEGRVLNREKLRAGQDTAFSSGEKADWTMSLRSNAMFAARNMDRLAVITPQSLHQPTDEFMKLICRAAQGMRWNTNNYKIFPIPNDRSGTYLDKLEEVINTVNPTLILCVLQNKTADRYNAIKKKCCVDRGIPTQVVVSRNFKAKGAMSIATKIAIQLNCKIGGAPWSVPIPLKGLMVVGYDVTRDTSSKGKSFGGMVASLDQNCTRYYSSVAEHQYEEELSNNFGSFLLLACQKYKEVNGFYPAKILIYRDGVGDGQIPHVMDYEIKNIIAKLESTIYTEEPVKMAFVIVSKRINTRIFDGERNPPPGTVVDNTITWPERYDFYIVSQCVNQGSVTPTSYNIVYDNMGLSPDQMQLLTYKMCHMYFNWSGTVRVPAPCQYAHKLSFLTAQSLHRPANRKLENVLYYL